MKYIIDIPNDSINKYVSLCDRESFVVPITVGLDSSLCFNTGLKLKPYTEPDRKAIEDAQEEAWKMASKCLWTITNSQSRVIFGMDGVYVPRDLSYQEAKAKYEAWKKQNDEIRVGDEVTFYIGPNDEMKAVALDQTGVEGEWSLLTENGCVEEHAEDFIRKTGRHFDEVEELLKKMNENSERLVESSQ